MSCIKNSDCGQSQKRALYNSSKQVQKLIIFHLVTWLLNAKVFFFERTRDEYAREFQWVDSLTSVLITEWIYWLFNTSCFCHISISLHDFSARWCNHAWCVLSTNKALSKASYAEPRWCFRSQSDDVLLKTAKTRLWFFWRRLYRDASRTVTCLLR